MTCPAFFVSARGSAIRLLVKGLRMLGLCLGLGVAAYLDLDLDLGIGLRFTLRLRPRPGLIKLMGFSPYPKSTALLA